MLDVRGSRAPLAADNDSSGSDIEVNQKEGGGEGLGIGLPSSPDEYAAAVLAAHQHALEVYALIEERNNHEVEEGILSRLLFLSWNYVSSLLFFSKDFTCPLVDINVAPSRLWFFILKSCS